MNLLLPLGGTEVFAYQYALDGDLYGAVTPVETQIRLMDLTPGPHNLHVVGWNTSGTMQGVPTEQRWDLVPGLGLTSLYELLLLK